MKRTLMTIGASFAVMLSIPPPAAGQRQADVDAINQLLDRYTALEDAMDMSSQATLMAEDRVWIAQGAGRRTDQARNMAVQQATFDALKAQVPGIQIFTEDRDRLIRFYGNGAVAVVSFYRYQTAILPPDAPEAVVAAWAAPAAATATLVLEKRGTDWKIVHTHFSSLAPPSE